jgi:hypothetical protein
MDPELPPEELPSDATAYWQSPPLPERPAPRELPSALERLGPSPFPKSRFPFLGFLATVYDEVANRMSDAAGMTPPVQPQQSPPPPTFPESQTSQ